MAELVSIKENGAFLRAYSRGKSYTDPTLVLYAVKNREGIVRIGITASKKTGNAVMRNRSRRVIREAFRSMSAEVSGGYDLVFVARRKTPYKSSVQIAASMRNLLLDAGLLKES